MPIYEFFCPDNNKIYSFLARSLSAAGKTPRCPENAKFRMERVVSPFAVTGRAKEEKADTSGDDLNDPRMESMMADMEREFSGMDEENPDPRQLARMMRRMTELSGEKTPAAMEEMIRRMEAGEDPEKLEEEYGDAFEEFEGGLGDGDAGADAETEPGGIRARLRRRRPSRDPQLYEMSEYID